MFNFKRMSGWRFETSAGSGIGLGVFGLEKGAFFLKNAIGRIERFDYEALGICVGSGQKLASIPKVQLNLSKTLAATGTGATSSMFSAGKVIVTNNCKTADLTPADFLGLCVFAEAYAGYGVGGSIYVMYFGIPAAKMPLAVASGYFGALPLGMLYAAKGVLLMGGQNYGLQSGLLFGGFLGSVYIGKSESPGLYADPTTGSRGASGMGSSQYDGSSGGSRGW